MPGDKRAKRESMFAVQIFWGALCDEICGCVFVCGLAAASGSKVGAFLVLAICVYGILISLRIYCHEREMQTICGDAIFLLLLLALEHADQFVRAPGAMCPFSPPWTSNSI